MELLAGVDKVHEINKGIKQKDKKLDMLSMEEDIITEKEMRKALKKMKMKKAVGYDDIPMARRGNSQAEAYGIA